MSRLPLKSNDGGSIDVIPVKSVEADSLYRRISYKKDANNYPDYPLKLEESTFLSLAAYFVDKYIDRSLVSQYRDVETEGDSFDYFGHNILRYIDVSRMLDEIMETAIQIFDEEETDTVKSIISSISPCALIGAYGMYFSPHEVFCSYRAEIVEYYREFCAAVKNVMNNAEGYELLDFCGP